MARSAAEIVRELVSAYNDKALGRLLALFHADAVMVDPFHPDGVRGHEAIGELLQGLFDALPDERMELAGLAVEGDRAVADYTSAGTSRAGDAFRLEFRERYELEDGLIRSLRVEIDPATLPL